MHDGSTGLRGPSRLNAGEGSERYEAKPSLHALSVSTARAVLMKLAFELSARVIERNLSGHLYEGATQVPTRGAPASIRSHRSGARGQRRSQ
jgi:hypothetical protein